MARCDAAHRVRIRGPQLLDLVAAGLADPAAFITQEEKPASAIEAYETFDRREEGWVKTVLDVS